MDPPVLPDSSGFISARDLRIPGGRDRARGNLGLLKYTGGGVRRMWEGLSWSRDTKGRHCGVSRHISGVAGRDKTTFSGKHEPHRVL